MPPTSPGRCLSAARRGPHGERYLQVPPERTRQPAWARKAPAAVAALAPRRPPPPPRCRRGTIGVQRQQRARPGRSPRLGRPVPALGPAETCPPTARRWLFGRHRDQRRPRPPCRHPITALSPERLSVLGTPNVSRILPFANRFIGWSPVSKRPWSVRSSVGACLSNSRTPASGRCWRAIQMEDQVRVGAPPLPFRVGYRYPSATDRFGCLPIRKVPTPGGVWTSQIAKSRR